MACYEVCLTLLALITCHVSANYEYGRLKSLNSEIATSPWNKQYEVYESASSEVLPSYSFYKLRKNRSTDRFGSPSEPYPIKKELIEQKSLKKVPFHSFTNKDSTKYKELTHDSGIAHCQEIKSTEKDELQKSITCYNCKDPKTKSTYQRCLYNHPEERTSANTNVERYLSAPTNFRYRRFSSERNEDNYGRRRNPYRFADEYFTDATHDIPAAYTNKEEKCDKIVKDSMVCMVCKDTKTNGKYEQCSYVKQPYEKAYSYKKSSSLGKPQEEKEDNGERPESTSYSEVSDSKAVNQPNDRSPSTRESPEYSYPSKDYSEKVNEQEEIQNAPSADCKQIEKDSKTCTVCKDFKRGGTYEKCTYNYQPSDKLYKYSRSKSFGHPDKTSDSIRDSNKTQTSKNYDYPHSSESTHDYQDKLSTHPRRTDRIIQVQEDSNDETDSVSYDHPPDYSSDYSSPDGSSNYQSSSSDDRPESYKGQKTPYSEHSEDISADKCETVQKDSMTCTVCKDPNTGNDFERCSYSYQPNDKLFSYSKSSSFGKPESDKSEQTSSDGAESARESYVEHIPKQSYEASTASEANSRDDPEGRKEAVDVGYLDTAKKKAEIEEFMQNFRKEDRSNCKKVMRDKMTCYKCVDEQGFQKEECAFVTGHEPDGKDQLAFHEVKEFQVDSTSQNRDYEPPSLTSSTKTEAVASHARDFKPSSSTKTKTKVEALEPTASASGNSYETRLEKPDNDYPDEASEHTAGETKEAEPYDYTSETRSKYDKVLKLTLPAYMFTTSEHEAAFDEIVASSHT
ncbi:hypothetical protein P5V15_000084 [Pogonomyrmex californicus]